MATARPPAGCPWVLAGPSRLGAGAGLAGAVLPVPPRRGDPRQVPLSKYEEKLLFSASCRVFSPPPFMPYKCLFFTVRFFFFQNHSLLSLIFKFNEIVL